MGGIGCHGSRPIEKRDWMIAWMQGCMGELTVSPYIHASGQSCSRFVDKIFGIIYYYPAFPNAVILGFAFFMGFCF
jgi:hypothetical protein